jgi:hypothetical protein
MALDLLRSGYATLEYEFAQEKASALGRLGRRLEAVLTALAACPRTANSERKFRESLVEQAGYALWLLVVQREAGIIGDRARRDRDRLLIVQRQLDHSHSYGGRSVYGWEAKYPDWRGLRNGGIRRTGCSTPTTAALRARFGT